MPRGPPLRGLAAAGALALAGAVACHGGAGASCRDDDPCPIDGSCQQGRLRCANGVATCVPSIFPAADDKVCTHPQLSSPGVCLRGRCTAATGIGHPCASVDTCAYRGGAPCAAGTHCGISLGLNALCTTVWRQDGEACGSGATCHDTLCGSCTDPGQADCGGVCASVFTDKANCGACGTACSPSQTCLGGVCVCPPLAPCAAGQKCVPNAACEAGTVCAEADDPVFPHHWRCSPAGAGLAAGTPCSKIDECQPGLTCVPDGGKAGVCAQTCNPSFSPACPAGQSCVAGALLGTYVCS